MVDTMIMPGTGFVGESHDFWECSYIKSGSTCSCVDGKIYDMEKGDLVFYKPMEFHQYHTNDDTGAEEFFFSFSFESCPEDFAADTVYKLNSHQQEIIRNIIDYADNAVKNNPFTEEEIALQKKEYINYKHVRPLLTFNNNPANMAMVVRYIEELFIDLYNTKNVVEETDSHHAGIYRNAIAYMTEHISEKITISDIAKHCTVSETALKKVFHQYANTSVHKHFLQLKITQAIILLKNGASAYEASGQVGFANQTHFSVAFKKETGLTPREYLKRNSN